MPATIGTSRADDGRVALLSAVNVAIDELLESEDKTAQTALELITLQVWGRHPDDMLADEASFGEDCGSLTGDIINTSCSTQCLGAVLQICKKALG